MYLLFDLVNERNRLYILDKMNQLLKSEKEMAVIDTVTHLRDMLMLDINGFE